MMFLSVIMVQHSQYKIVLGVLMQEQEPKYVFSPEEIKHLSDFFLLLFKIWQRVRSEQSGDDGKAIKY